MPNISKNLFAAVMVDITLPRRSKADRPASRNVRIAVLVHNSIIHDARVIKEIHTLEGAGFAVTAFGLTGKHELPRVERLDGMRTSINLGSPKLELRRIKKKRKWFRGPSRRTVKRVIRICKLITKRSILSRVAIVVLIGSALLNWQFSASATSLLSTLAWVAFLFFSLYAFGRLLRSKTTKNQQEYIKTLSQAKVHQKESASTEAAEVAKKRRLIRSHSAALEELVTAHGSFDVYHCHDIIALEAGTALVRKFGGALIWDAHELYEHLARDEPSRSRANRNIIDEATELVSGCITINESIANYYCQSHPGLPRPAVVMNATLKTPQIHDDGRLRAAAQLPEDARILIYQGGFSPNRGLQTLIESMRFVEKPWTLVMMGWGKIEAQLKSAAAIVNEGIADQSSYPRIVFLPAAPQSELAFWTAGANLGVIAYEDICLNHKFCTPNKLWEYPNAGVPILASDLVEMRKMIEAWDTGFLMPADCDPRALATRVSAISDEELQAKRQNCSIFRDKHNWSRFEPVLLDVYEGLQVGTEAA